jgi:predicted phosphodiesterase
VKVQIVSDLHTDTRYNWLQTLESQVVLAERPKTLLVAGDTAEVRSGTFRSTYRYLSRYYTDIIAVLGNHEHYGATRSQVTAALKLLPSNVRVLQEETVTLNGFKFGGTSLWFGKNFNPKLKAYIADFKAIPNFEPWVYQTNHKAREFLNQPLDVWLTHHLPHYYSINTRWVGSPANCFFVDDCSELMRYHAPLLCVHGHSHDAVDYEINGLLGEPIRVLSNPLGYRKESSGFKYLVAELTHRH